MKEEHKVLLAMIRSALWSTQPELEHNTDWVAVREAAKSQTVLPLCFSAILNLPLEVSPSRAELIQWFAVSESIQEQNGTVNSVLHKVHHALDEAKVPHVFMKGQTVAARYDDPLLRTPGDIDFVVGREGYDSCMSVLERMGKVDYSLMHEHHGLAYIDGVTLEPHYKVHNYQSPANDREMDSLMHSVFPAHLASVTVDGVEVPVFPVTFESVFLISHVVNHVYEEGVGLRQLCDWVMLLRRDASKIDWQLHAEYLRRIRMTCSFRILGYMCETYLGLPASVLDLRYTASERRVGERLFADILGGGNFGRAQYAFTYNNKWSEWRNYAYVAKRAIRFYGFCPSEARMWPVAKVVRYAKKTLGLSLK